MIFAKAKVTGYNLEFSVGDFSVTKKIRKIRVYFTDKNNESAMAYALLRALTEARRDFCYSIKKDGWRKHDDIFKGKFYIAFSGDYNNSMGGII